jgi:hypothetical protein
MISYLLQIWSRWCVCVCVCVLRLKNWKKNTENIYQVFLGVVEVTNPRIQHPGKTYILKIMPVIFFSSSGQMQRQYLHRTTTTSFQIPSNLSLTNHGRQNGQCDMLTAASGDPHNINTSSLLSIRYTASNTAPNFFFFFTLGFLFPLLHLILFPPLFVTLWYYYLLTNWFIYVFIHYCPLSPYFLSLYTFNSSVLNSLVYSFLLVLRLSLKYPAHLRYILNSLSPCTFFSFLPSFLFNFMSSTSLRDDSQSPRTGLSNVRLHNRKEIRSQWPRGLRRGSAATRLLGLWV